MAVAARFLRKCDAPINKKIYIKVVVSFEILTKLPQVLVARQGHAIRGFFWCVGPHKYSDLIVRKYQ